MEIRLILSEDVAGQQEVESTSSLRLKCSLILHQTHVRMLKKTNFQV